MKNILLIALSLYLYSNAEATVRTVCNMPYSPGQFTTVTAALTASSINDTIYVHGSTVSYETLILNKAGIVIIGPGHNPDKQAPMTASFNLIEVRDQNCQIIGLTVNHIAVMSFSTGTIIRRCKILNNGIVFQNTANGCIIEGNVFTGINYNIDFYYNSVINTIIRNNIFNGRIANTHPSGSPTSSLQINHNNFLGTVDAFYYIYNAVINDNIFWRSSPSGTFDGCTMNNNIRYNTASVFSAPGINNLTTDPLFLNFPLPYFDYSHDYHVAPASPAVVAGIDGTDIGVYGGFGNKFNMTGEPAIAEITSFTITSATAIPPGGTLNINVQSKSVR